MADRTALARDNPRNSPWKRGMILGTLVLAVGVGLAVILATKEYSSQAVLVVSMILAFIIFSICGKEDRVHRGPVIFKVLVLASILHAVPGRHIVGEIEEKRALSAGILFYPVHGALREKLGVVLVCELLLSIVVVRGCNPRRAAGGVR